MRAAKKLTSVLCSQSLRVVEVSWDGNDGLLDLLANLGLSNLLHLGQDHGRDLLWGELLGLAEVLDLDDGCSVSVNDGEWPALHVLLDVWVVISSSDESLGVEDYRIARGIVRQLQEQCSCCESRLVFQATKVHSPVCLGFMAAWFFAESPMSRSESVKAT